jgi:hypothetical protein
MDDEIAAAPPIRAACRWTRSFLKLRNLSGLLAASLLLAGAPANSQTSSTATSRPLATQRSKRPPGASAQMYGGDAKAGATTVAQALDAVPIERRREIIARVVEQHNYFRTVLDGTAPKLTNAKFAGPFVTGGSFFPRRIMYCAQAEVPMSLSPTRTAAIWFPRNEDGSERILMKVNTSPPPYECMLAKYGPFPELVRVREERRRAMGKPN